VLAGLELGRGREGTEGRMGLTGPVLGEESIGWPYGRLRSRPVHALAANVDLPTRDPTRHQCVSAVILGVAL